MSRQEVIYRHSSTVRVTHWVNVVVLLVLLMSGLQIFNAHPALYFGSKSNFDDPVMAMRPMRHGEDLVGVTTIAGWNIDTTNVFGLAYAPDGDYEVRGFPWSVTLPGHRDLSTGRRWHFFFAWLFVINGLALSHLQPRERPSQQGSRAERQRAETHRRSIWDHLRLKFPRRRGGQALQRAAEARLSHRGARASAADARDRSRHVAGHGRGLPFLLEIFGGRQSARTIHFISASGIVLFVVVHVVMVLISGVWNNIRSMITGRYVIKEPGSQHERGTKGGPARLPCAAASPSPALHCSPAATASFPTSLGSSAFSISRDSLRASPSEHWSRPRRLPANIARPTSRRTSRRTDRPTSTTTHTGHLPRMGLATGSSKVDGLVGQPLELSLAELRAMPSRTQITRHDCVEGWSCIGKWTGVPLKALLDKAELKPSARYIVFYCADDLGETGDDEGKYYE